MKQYFLTRWVATAVALSLVFATLRIVSAEDPVFTRSPIIRAQVATPSSPMAVNDVVVSDASPGRRSVTYGTALVREQPVLFSFFDASSNEVNTASLHAAAKELWEAKELAAKKAAEEKLRQQLDSYFEQDMKRREAELKSMQDRLAKLQAQLNLRREKQKDIVDLQIKVLIAEAGGLGFFSSGHSPMGPDENRYFYSPGGARPYSSSSPSPFTNPSEFSSPHRDAAGIPAEAPVSPSNPFAAEPVPNLAPITGEVRDPSVPTISPDDTTPRSAPTPTETPTSSSAEPASAPGPQPTVVPN